MGTLLVLQAGCELIAGVEDGELATSSATTAAGSGPGGAGGAAGSGGSTGVAGHGATAGSAGAGGAVGGGAVGGGAAGGGTPTGATGGTGGTGGGTPAGGTGGAAGGTPSGEPTTDAYYDAVMADEPIGYFRFAEPAGNICQNEVAGSPLTATYPTTGATRAVGGIRPENAAVRFDSESAQLTVFGGVDLPGDVAFTIEAWVRVDALGTTGRLFSHNDSSPLHGTWLGKWSTNDHLRTETWDHGTIFFYTLSQDVIPEDVWLHVVLRHVAGDRDYLYVNGAEGEGARVGVGDRSDVTSNFRWGGFIGELDEFAVYDKALATGRIAAHMVAQAQ